MRWYQKVACVWLARTAAASQVSAIIGRCIKFTIPPQVTTAMFPQRKGQPVSLPTSLWQLVCGNIACAMMKLNICNRKIASASQHASSPVQSSQVKGCLYLKRTMRRLLGF